MYTPEFNEWWIARLKKTPVPAARRASAKRWAFIGWEARKADDKERERVRGEEFRAGLERDKAKGIDITSPGYWGDFS